jgi:two-component system, cell cycle sensor histidine kinase and response regulator CckA
MTELDLHTLLSSVVGLNVLFTIVLALFCRTQRVYRGFRLWTVGSFLMTVASVLLRFTEAEPALVAGVVAGSLMVLSAVIWLEGMRIFLGREGFDYRLLAVPVAVAVLLVFLSYMRDDLAVGIVIVSIATSLVFLAIAASTIFRAPRSNRAGFAAAAGPFALYGCVMLARGLYWAIERPANSGVFDHNGFDISLLFMALVLNAISIMVFVSLNHWRTTQELEAEKHLSDGVRVRQENIIAFLPDCTFVVDAEGLIVAWNKAAEAQLGVPASEALGRPAAEVFRGNGGDPGPLLAQLVLDSSLAVPDRFREVERQGETLSAVMDGIRLDGSTFVAWVRAVPLRDASGKVTGAVESIRDITARLRTEELLEESEKRYGSLFEFTPDAVLVSRAGGAILDVNPAACSMFRMTRNELCGATLSSIIQTSMTTDAVPGRWGRGGHASERSVVLHEDGSALVAEGTSTIIPDSGDPPICFTILRDISERFEYECQLAESEERFRTLVEQAPQPIFLQVEGRFAYANRAAKDLFRESADAPLVGQLIEDRMHEEFRQTLRDRMRLTDEGRVAPLMGRTVLDMEGNPIEVEASAVPFTYRGKRGALVFASDVTTRIRAEAELRDSAARLEKAQAVARMGDFEFDLASRTFVLSAESRRILGLNGGVGRIPGHEFSAMIHEDDLPQLMAGMQTHRQPPEGGEFEFRLRLADGAIRTVRSLSDVVLDESGRLAKVVGTLQDVTEERAAEEALRLTQYSVDNASDAVFWTDADGCIIYASDSACESLGYKREELFTMRVWEIDPMETEEGFREKWDSVHDAGGFVFETVHCRRNGEVFPAEVSLNHVTYRGRELNCVFARDISERRRTEAALKDSEDRLRQSQKMEAVGRLAGGIAHDFNNLLTTIIGYSDLVLGNEAVSGLPVEGDVREIKAAAERAGALTRQILAFSRRQALRPTVVSLNEILTGMEPLLVRTLGEDIELVISMDPDLATAEVDSHQFEQVIMNLAVNARDAMPLGGRLTFETANLDLDDDSCGVDPDRRPGAYVALTATDTGVGMDSLTASHIFEPFFTTKGVGQGTGLGLSTVHGIVHQSGGTIDVFSEPGAGSMFRVLLPQAEPGDAEDVDPDSVAPPARGGETVLVVEDDAALRTLVSRMLETLGYRTIVADDGERALAFLGDDGARIDLLLTDIVLPGALRGDVLALRAVTLRPGLPVIHMSGYAQNALAHGGRLNEGVNFIAKPFTSDALAKIVREVLDRSGSGGVV